MEEEVRQAETLMFLDAERLSISLRRVENNLLNEAKDVHRRRSNAAWLIESLNEVGNEVSNRRFALWKEFAQRWATYWQQEMECVESDNLTPERREWLRRFIEVNREMANDVLNIVISQEEERQTGKPH
ncbi:MAG TPA: hypothetical protein PLG17_10910 [Thermodesulfobacteriota bacterium]|nr:hypothetical protein [Thermodesulfobacteriota bacterium]